MAPQFADTPERPKAEVLRMTPGRSLRRLPGRPAFGVGRPELRRAIVTALGRRAHCVALTGPLGVGKSGLAAEYAHANIGRYEIVWYVAAHDQTQVRVELAALGRTLGIAEHVPAMELPEATAAWLRQRSGWLLLLDSVGDMDAIERLIPLNGPGHVVMVAEPSVSVPRWMHSVSVPVIGKNEAGSLLRLIAGWGPDIPIDRFLSELGTRPRSIDWAGRLSRLAGLDPGQPVTQLRPSNADTSNLSHYIRKALPSGSAERALLYTGALLGPAPIPLSVFDSRPGPCGRLARALPHGPALVDAVQRLVDLGLCTTISQTISIDPQVAAVIERLIAGHRREWEDVALGVAKALFQRQGFISRFDDDLLDAELVSIARHVANTTEPTSERFDSLVKLHMISATAYGSYSRQPSLAIEELDKAIALMERYSEGPDDDLALMHFNVGVYRFERGDLGGAVVSVGRAGDLLSEEPDKSEQLRMIVALYLAKAHGRLGQLERAQSDYQEFFACARAGDVALRHSEVVALIDELGSYLVADGGSGRSVSIIVEAFEVLPNLASQQARPRLALAAARLASQLSRDEHEGAMQRLLVLAHDLASRQPTAQRIRLGLSTACMLHERGHLDQEAHVLGRVSELLTDDDLPPSERGSCWAEYASLLADAADHEAAVEYQRRALDELENASDADPRAIALVIHDLTSTLCTLGRTDDAAAIYGDRVQLDSVSKSAAADLLLLGLARLQRFTADPDALATYERALELREGTLGPADPDTVMLRAELAAYLLGTPARARARDHAAEVAKQLLEGQKPPGIQASSLAHLATIELTIGHLTGARSTLERLLELLEQRAPIDPDDLQTVSDIMARLAAALAEQGLHTEACAAATNGFELLRRAQTQPDAQAIERANDIGLLLQQDGRGSAASEWVQEAARLAEAIGGTRLHEATLANAAGAGGG